jgi:hypothetical protein
MNEYATDQVGDQKLLDHFQYMLEKEIYNYALDEVEDCCDKENDQILRGLKWSRGDKDYWIVISPLGQIRWIEKKTPKELLIQIHNVAMDIMIEAAGRLHDVRISSNSNPEC